MKKSYLVTIKEERYVQKKFEGENRTRAESAALDDYGDFGGWGDNDYKAHKIFSIIQKGEL